MYKRQAYDIFIESSFSLSDGFDEHLLEDYQKAIMEIPKISKVKSQRGRTYGSNIYLDITLEMNPDPVSYQHLTTLSFIKKSSLWGAIGAKAGITP